MASPGAGALLLPAGPADRVLVRAGEPSRLLPTGTEPELRSGERLVAVDLDGRAPEDALVGGRVAHDGLAAALLRLGAERLAAEHRGDDLEALVLGLPPRRLQVAEPELAQRYVRTTQVVAR